MPRKNVKKSEDSNTLDFLSIGSRRSISEDIFAQLRDAILAGTLPEGYVFPNENTLCQQLNIGRGSLREAYASLETLNLITRSKTGTYVNPPSVVENSMNFEAIAQREDDKALFDYRCIIEVGTVGLAAQAATQEDADGLERIIEKMKEVKDDPDTLAQYDFDFHSRLVDITQNKLLLISLNTIRGVYEDYTKSVFAAGYTDQFFEDHRAIVDAIRENNREKAEQMMAEHLKRVDEYSNRVK